MTVTLAIAIGIIIWLVGMFSLSFVIWYYVINI